MDLSAYSLGKEAARLLLERVSDPSLVSERRLVPHSIVERETTPRLRTGGPAGAPSPVSVAP
jgi:DNA-binding LacI/PurR family transcriptional regulator